ncbi:MAG: ATP phosphoribosyltransferase [Duodenibacillus sp.]|nr:ATP phosphoribosyltransferase [Duodenibacillus sp.]
MITLALSKGRIYQELLPFLEHAGVVPLEDPEQSRKLMIATNRPDLRIVVLRATDVPTYVQHGAADMGVCGWDTLYEHGGNGLYVPVDLQIARCRMCVAAPAGFDWDANVRRGSRLRIATKYLKWSRDYFAREGVHVDLIKLYGSMELAPIAGLADAIVDLVSSGATLRANNMVEIKTVGSISSRLIVNQSAMKIKRERLQPIISDIREAAEERARARAAAQNPSH